MSSSSTQLGFDAAELGRLVGANARLSALLAILLVKKHIVVSPEINEDVLQNPPPHLSQIAELIKNGSFLDIADGDRLGHDTRAVASLTDFLLRALDAK